MKQCTRHNNSRTRLISIFWWRSISTTTVLCRPPLIKLESAPPICQIKPSFFFFFFSKEQTNVNQREIAKQGLDRVTGYCQKQLQKFHHGKNDGSMDWVTIFLPPGTLTKLFGFTSSCDTSSSCPWTSENTESDSSLCLLTSCPGRMLEMCEASTPLRFQVCGLWTCSGFF